MRQEASTTLTVCRVLPPPRADPPSAPGRPTRRPGASACMVSMGTSSSGRPVRPSWRRCVCRWWEAFLGLASPAARSCFCQFWAFSRKTVATLVYKPLLDRRSCSLGEILSSGRAESAPCLTFRELPGWSPKRLSWLHWQPPCSRQHCCARPPVSPLLVGALEPRCSCPS